MFFDPNEKIENDFGPLPTDTYTVKVESSSYGPTSKGNGMLMTVTLVTTDAPFKGRKLWARFNVENPNPQAQKIGRVQMKEFLEAAGLGKKPIATPEEFHKAVAGRTLRADVEVQSGGKYNDVVGFRSMFSDNGAAPEDNDELPF